jgi:plasmid stability protein
MATLTIRKLDEPTKQRLRMRAAHHQRSMEEEARIILRNALEADAATPRDLAHAIHRRFKAIGGIDLVLPPRDRIREPPPPAG